MTRLAPALPRGAELLYALAYLGAHLAFMPLFVLLLPRRVEAIAGGPAVGLLSLLLLVGGIAASLGHIAAGALSDRWILRFGRRRGLIAIGAGLLGLAYGALALARTPFALGCVLVAYQLALNLMFAPLGALLADHVEDERKGRVAALMNIALPLSGLGTALAASAFPSDGPGGFLVIAGLSLAAVLPLVLFWPFGEVVAARAERAADAPALAATDYARVWGARLLMQLGAAFLLNYFYLFLSGRPGLDGPLASRLLGTLAAAAMVASVAAALLSGTWSDRARRRRRPMIAGALMAAIALAVLAVGSGREVWAASYVLFNAGLIAFLSIDSALVAQLVSGHPRRGELLGYMNLTNTLPSILVPALTLTALGAQPDFDWTLGFALAGALALGAATLVARIRAIA